jgi:hypothetical protein
VICSQTGLLYIAHANNYSDGVPLFAVIPLSTVDTDKQKPQGDAERWGGGGGGGGGGMVFCLVQNFFSDNTRVRIFFFFCRAKRTFFSPEFNIRLYDKKVGLL